MRERKVQESETGSKETTLPLSESEDIGREGQVKEGWRGA
jgi:hypothetical protein